MRQSYRLIWNSVVIWLLRILRLFPELILIPYIIGSLGESLFGIYILGWSLVPVFDLLRMGMSSGLVKYSAEFFEKGEIENINKSLSTSCVLSGGLGLAAGVILLIVVNFFSGWLKVVSPQYAHLLKLTCNTVAVMIITTFPIMPYAGIIHALQRYDIYNLIYVSFVYLRVTVIIGWFVLFEPSYEALIYVSVTSYILRNLANVFVAKKLLPGVRCSFRFVERQMLRLLLSFGGIVLLCSLCTIINTTGVKWIVGTLISPAFVGVLAIIQKPPHMIKELIQAMTLSLMPAASRYSVRQDPKLLRELFVKSTRYINLVLLAGMVEIVFVIMPLMHLWLGADYVYLVPFIIVLSGGTCIWMSSSAAVQVLRGLGMLRETLLSYVIGPVLTTIPIVVLSIIFGYKGYWPVVIGYLAGFIVSSVIRFIFCTKRLNIHIGMYIWQTFGQVLVVTLPPAAVFFMLAHYFNIDGFVGRQSLAAVSIGLAAVLFLVFFVTGQEKRLAVNIKDSLQRRIRR